MLGLPFTCIPSSIDETPGQGLSPGQTAEDLARRKTLAVVEKLNLTGLNRDTRWVFGADTIVVLDNEIYGKPADRDSAGKMLECLAGRRHEVITAMALYNGKEKKTGCRSVSCDVTFAPLTGAEIEWYLDSGEWQGAAGAYRLQGLGGCLVSSVNGSPSAVAGLPLHDFYDMLRDSGYPFGA